MSNPFVFSTLKYLIKIRYKTYLKNILISFLLALLLGIIYNIATISINWVNYIANDINVSVVINTSLDSISFKNSLKDIKNIHGISNIQYISSQQSFAELNKLTGVDISTELMPNNPIPPILKISIAQNYQSKYAFESIINTLYSIPVVQEIHYRTDYVYAFISCKELFMYSMIGFAAFIFILYLIFSVQLNNHVHLLDLDDYSVQEQLGMSRLSYMMPNILFNFSASLVAYILFGLGIVIIYYSIKDIILIDINYLFISNIIFISSLIVLQLIIALFFYKKTNKLRKK